MLSLPQGLRAFALLALQLTVPVAPAIAAGREASDCVGEYVADARSGECGAPPSVMRLNYR